MKLSGRIGTAIVSVMIALLASVPGLAQAQGKQPNIIMIMGDDIGWANIGAYNQASFNLEAVKAQLEKTRAAHGQ